MRLVLALLLAAVGVPGHTVCQRSPGTEDPVQKARATFDMTVAKDGPDSLSAATARLPLAKALMRRGDALEAEAAARAALEVFEAHLPEQDLPAADALLVLGASHGTRDDLCAAAGFYRRALTIRERHDPPGAPYLQLLRFNLAVTLQQLMDLRDALELAETALRDANPTPGAETAGVGNLLAVTALCLDGLGNFRKAHERYLRAERILRRTCGEHYPDAVRMAGLAGTTECRMGHADTGLPRMASALAEMRASPSCPPAVICELETADAMLRAVWCRDASAESALRHAYQRLEDPSLPAELRASRRLMLMSMLADFDPHAIDLDVARRALADLETLYGPDHEQIAAMLADLARLLVAKDQIEEARRCIERALSIVDKAPWFVSVDRWKILWSAAGLCRASGRLPDALSIVERGLTQLPGLLDAWLSPLDEQQRLEFTAAARAALDLGLSVESTIGQPAAERWRLVLQWKSLVSQGMLQSLQWLHENRDIEAQRLADDLRSAVARWSALVRAGALPADIAAARLDRTRIEQAFEKRLAAKAHTPPLPSAIAAALADDEVLIDFLSYGHIRNIGAIRDIAIEERLLAFVVRRGQEPELVDLGPLEPIVVAVADFLRVGSRWIRPMDGADALVTAAGTRVAELLWNPLRSLVPDDSKVTICPDSVVAVVPFACLPGRENGTFLLEHHEFGYVANPADVLERDRPAMDPVPSLLVIGDVDYGGDGIPTGDRAGPSGFAPLPGSGPEIDMVARLFATISDSKPAVLRGAAATADAVTHAVAGTGYVHVATHGWYLGSRALPDVDQRWRNFEARGKSLPADSMAPGAAGGIALAGANVPHAEGTDGVLSADEIALLDLGHCELAVLSACETGLGTVSAGDGLLGLRRALRLAGARRSLTSIWRVDDLATRRCMEEFYRELWTAHRAPTAALRAAQLAMLRAARTGTGQALVGTWGAFVLESR